MVLAAASLSLIALTSASAAGSISTLTLRSGVTGAAAAAGGAGCCWACALAKLAAIDSAAAIKDFIWTRKVGCRDGGPQPLFEGCDLCASAKARRAHEEIRRRLDSMGTIAERRDEASVAEFRRRENLALEHDPEPIDRRIDGHRRTIEPQLVAWLHVARA